MKNGILMALSVCYFILGVLYFTISIRRILRFATIGLFDGVRLMYSFVCGFVPALIYFFESSGERNLRYYDYSPSGLLRLFLLLLINVACFSLLNLAYFSIKKEKIEWRRFDDTPGNADDLFTCSIIATAIGGVSLILWTAAYGSVQNFILNAARIRSGRGELYNRFAFMKQFTRILPLSLFGFISYWYRVRPQGLRKIKCMLLLFLSVFLNYIYLLASDSRMSIALTGLGVVLILLRHRRKQRIKGYIITYGSVVLMILFVTMSADTLTRFYRTGVWMTREMGFFRMVLSEFRFTQSAEMMAMRMLMNGKLTIKLFDDLLIALTSWIPERFLPFDLPLSTWSYNTVNIAGTLGNGTSPCDIIATGIYEMGVLGIILWPFLYGRLVGSIEKLIARAGSSPYQDVYYGIFAVICSQQVCYSHLYSFTVNCFPVFLFWLITVFVKAMKHYFVGMRTR